MARVEQTMYPSPGQYSIPSMKKAIWDGWLSFLDTFRMCFSEEGFRCRITESWEKEQLKWLGAQSYAGAVLVTELISFTLGCAAAIPNPVLHMGQTSWPPYSSMD